jgi:uncharacterized protein with PIN domain
MNVYADAMLSRMGRWLRMLGFDTEIADVETPDKDVIKAVGDRALITRDKLLYQRAKSRRVKAYYIHSRTVREQLHEFFSLTGTETHFPENSRCSLCNGVLKRVDREETYAPKNVRSERFWKCGDCGKSYWQGSHWAKISKIAEELGA